MAADFEELFREGYRARKEGRVANSRAIFLDAVRKAAEAGEESSLAEAMCGLAQAERDIGNCPAAGHHYANAVLLYRRVGSPERLAYALRHEADVLRQVGRAGEAEPLYREAEGIYREAGENGVLDLANTLRGLALVKEAAGEDSRGFWREARVLYGRLGVGEGVAECERRLAG